MDTTASQAALEALVETRLYWQVRDLVARAFDVRDVFVLVEKRGRLSPLGEPSGERILRVSLLLARLNMRVTPHGHVASEFSASTILRALPYGGHGSIMAAPLFHWGRTLGLLVVEGMGAHNFDEEDFRRLGEIAETCALALLGEGALAETGEAGSKA
jgi:hypothetical protein